jgi:Leucine-rich repeat (LRR) protein
MKRLTFLVVAALILGLLFAGCGILNKSGVIPSNERGDAEEGDIITFEDPNLEQVIREKINKPEGTLYVSDVIGIVELNAHSRCIKSIGGIQYLQNIQKLDFNDNQVTDISALAPLANLQYLDFSYNQVTDISALAPLANLNFLYFCHNQVSDISAVQNLTNLKELYFCHNQVSDISAVQNLTNLKYLFFWNNQVSDISAVQNLTNLKELYFWNNQVSDISAVQNLTNLFWLNFDDNQVSDISALATMTNLENLWFLNNQVSDISALATMTNLDNLGFPHNQVSDISALQNLTNLDSLYFDNNQVSDIAALVNNPGIGRSDYVDMRNNYLDLTEGSQNMQDIDTLLSRRVNVEYFPQSITPPPEDNPPTIEIISPSESETVSGTVRFSTNATDDHGLEKVEFYIDDELKVTHGPFAPNLIESTFNWDCDTIHLSNGIHTFKAKAYDNTGQTNVDTISFIVDNVTGNCPYIDSIEPSSGAPGIEATIKGRNFDSIVIIRLVTFGGQSAKIINWSDTEIVVEVPSGEGVVDVEVRPTSPESNSVPFTYNEPYIDWISPSFGSPDVDVSLNGKDFGYIKGISPSFWVMFGCSSARTLSWEDTEIIAEAPSDYGTGEKNRTFLKWLIKFAAMGADIIMPPLVDEWIAELLTNCEIEIPQSGGNLKVDVTVRTPAGTSNAAVFTYNLSRIIEANLCSPGELRIYDSLERVTGLVNGEAREEIPSSLCDDSSVIIVSPDDSYRYEIVGTDEGTYGLEVNYIQNKEITAFSATDIPTTSGAIHQYIIDWNILSQGGEGVTVQIDFDGDGTSELTIPAGSNFILTPAIIDIDPATLNLKSRIKWVTACIELPGGYNVADIDVDTVKLWYEGNSVPAEWGDNQDGTLMIKFNGNDVQGLFPGIEDTADVTVAGKLYDGTPFIGSDAIRLILSGRSN